LSHVSAASPAVTTHLLRKQLGGHGWRSSRNITVFIFFMWSKKNGVRKKRKKKKKTGQDQEQGQRQLKKTSTGTRDNSDRWTYL
jgi:hypothetical protein